MPAPSGEAPLLGHSFLGTSFGRRELGNFVGSPIRVGFPGGSDKEPKNLPAMWETPGSIPGSGRSPGEGNGYPLQYSRLENSMDRST